MGEINKFKELKFFQNSIVNDDLDKGITIL